MSRLFLKRFALQLQAFEQYLRGLPRLLRGNEVLQMGHLGIDSTIYKGDNLV